MTGGHENNFDVVNVIIVQTPIFLATADVWLQLLYVGNGPEGKHRVGESKLAQTRSTTPSRKS